MSANIITFEPRNQPKPVLRLVKGAKRAQSFPATAVEAVIEQAQKTQRWDIVEQVAKSEEPRVVIHDDSQITMKFNVMPNRDVTEDFFIREYRVWHRYAEATLDREYTSSMEKSPDHLIFLTGCAHSQKLFYIALAHEFGFGYSPDEKEKFKIWPTAVRVSMPAMVRQNQDVIQKLFITKFNRVTDKVFEINFRTTYNDIVTIEMETKVYFI